MFRRFSVAKNRWRKKYILKTYIAIAFKDFFLRRNFTGTTEIVQNPEMIRIFRPKYLYIFRYVTVTRLIVLRIMLNSMFIRDWSLFLLIRLSFDYWTTWMRVHRLLKVWGFFLLYGALVDEKRWLRWWMWWLFLPGFILRGLPNSKNIKREKLLRSSHV